MTSVKSSMKSATCLALVAVLMHVPLGEARSLKTRLRVRSSESQKDQFFAMSDMAHSSAAASALMVDRVNKEVDQVIQDAIQQDVHEGTGKQVGQDTNGGGKVAEKSENPVDDASPSPPPAEPHQEMYDKVNTVANTEELRRGPSFTPGGKPGVDMSKQDEFVADTFFSQDPSTFGHCTLIHSFAEPLHVGSAMMTVRTRLHKEHPKAPKKWHGNATEAILLQDAPAVPDRLLTPKGGITNRDVGDTVGPDGNPEDDSELEVNMFAWLESVTGQVAVVPNGGIANWGSQEKVPIAGYLCSLSDGQKVLHTLPTPCVPTSIDNDGVAYPPPDDDMSAAPAPGPAAATLFSQVEADVAAAEQVTDDAMVTSKLNMRGSRRAPSAPAPSPAAQSSGTPYHVWVGSAKMEFSSKNRAEAFCEKLTKEIADANGNQAYDTDKLNMMVATAKQNMYASDFVALTRRTKKAWTLGKKKVLVVVMDWMDGDYSYPPNSRQTLTPKFVKETIFPRVQKEFEKMSYGRFTIEFDVIPWVVKYIRPRRRYSAGGYPFPGLYNGAEEAVMSRPSLRRDFNFKKYDLTYTLSPQQKPTGTKGVAWVGSKGAMCNGCEMISENFQVMVAVHELGHCLGLWHASSSSLEYGNVYDWMGNYPDVTGLSYGLGYKLRLNWLPESAMLTYQANELWGGKGLNDKIFLMPIDDKYPVEGQKVGVRIRLPQYKRDFYIAFREAPGSGKNGIFLTMQDRDKPNSELIDAACHSPSQQDAALQEGWTYIDPLEKFAIHVASITQRVATVRVVSINQKTASTIRGLTHFTDGARNCPRLCTDADLLVSQYKGCGALAGSGYCNGGAITMGGRKLTIGKDLCPKACNNCQAVRAGGSGGASACADKKVKISGMQCPTIASKGYCNYNTNIGHIGNDLCKQSCGNCPPAPPPATPAGPPPPAGGSKFDAIVGKASATKGIEKPDPNAKPAASTNQAQQTQANAAQDKKDEDAAAVTGQQGNSGGTTCTDDGQWTDADGDGCEVYKQAIGQRKLTRGEACSYNKDAAKTYCRRTCKTCPQGQSASISDSTCEDKMCVQKWRLERGKCFACPQYSSHCNEAHFASDCPRTCGLCEADGLQTTPPLPVTPEPITTTAPATFPPTEGPTALPACKDDKCVASWLKSFGECHKCEDFADDYCGRDELFTKSCAKTCMMCSDDKPACFDDFLPHTCKRYTEWGWCATAHIADHCKASCGLCAAEAAAIKKAQEAAQKPAAGADDRSNTPKSFGEKMPGNPLPQNGGARRGASCSIFTCLAACMFCIAALFGAYP